MENKPMLYLAAGVLAGWALNAGIRWFTYAALLAAGFAAGAVARGML